MSFVDDTDRQHEQTAPSFLSFAQIKRHICLLQLNLAGLALTGNAVFQLQFQEKADAVVEFVANEEYESMKVDLFAAASVLVHVRVMHLTVTTHCRTGSTTGMLHCIGSSIYLGLQRL